MSDTATFADRYGPWAVIAGASDGTGRAFAHAIAAKGLSCVLIARRQDPLDSVAAEIRAQYGVACVTASVDLAAVDAGARVAAAVGDREVGLLVCNAGADPYGARFLERDIGDWLALAQRNVTTLLQLCHQFAGPMRARGRGGLLLVNSGAGYGGGTNLAVYSATKAFMLNLAEGLWAELRPFNVDVLTLVLTATDTPSFHTLLADKGAPTPGNLAAPADVAALGLARLPHGPIHNWGQRDDEAGYAMVSPDDRRARIEFMDAVSAALFGEQAGK